MARKHRSTPIDDQQTMQYDEIDLRVREANGTHVIEIDGYHHVQPESKSGEYRRVALVDLSEAQARELHEELGILIDEWDSETSNEQS